MTRLVIKTEPEDLYSYAKRNLKALISGRLPESKWKPISNRKNVYGRRDDFDCLTYYRSASMSGRVKKIPFFVYWLILKQQRLFTRARLNDALNPGLRPQASWINNVEGIISDLSKDSDLSPGIQKKLDITYCSFSEHKNRLFLRYQKKGTARDAIFNMLQENPIGQIRSEILEFIDRHGTTTWREMRRNKRSIQKIRPEILKWILEELEEEGKIHIHVPFTKVYIQNRKNH